MPKIRINFILPFKARRPAGGFRVMYEYANRLSRRGYDVHLTYPIKTKYMDYRLPYFVRRILSKIEGFKRNNWFDFDEQITMSYVPEVKNQYVIDADIVIATWWTTVAEMGKLSVAKGRKVNLIQGYEIWTGREEEVHASYNLENTTNVVVASYLEAIVKRHSSNPLYVIHNAVDSEVFNMKIEPEDRSAESVIMTYSAQELKGSRHGVEALEIVKEKYPNLKVDLFGVAPKSEELHNWMEYHRDPKNLTELYNRNAIFISNSFTEGFPLTAAEAMFCGCAMIGTDIAGHREFAIDNDTALLVEVKNSKAMAEKIIHLIENDKERCKLARNGNEYIQKFDWDSAVKKMEAVIKSLLA